MDNLESLTSSALQAIEQAGNAAELDSLRVQYLGKKGSLTEQLKALGKLPAEEGRLLVQPLISASNKFKKP